MSVQKIFGAMLAIVIGLLLIPVVQSSTDNYDIVNASQTYTAVSDETIAEVVTLDNTPTTVKAVFVNGITTEDYTLAGNDITLGVATSTTDDVISVTYEYQAEMSTAIDTLVTFLPLVFILILVIGAVGYIKFSG